jgi:formylglycine-generating enzyme required for sulfatase activity
MGQQKVEEQAQGNTSTQDRRVWAKDGKEIVRVPAGEFVYGDTLGHPATYIRAALRSLHHPDDRYDTDGFRCVV